MLFSYIELQCKAKFYHSDDSLLSGLANVGNSQFWKAIFDLKMFPLCCGMQELWTIQHSLLQACHGPFWKLAFPSVLGIKRLIILFLLSRQMYSSLLDGRLEAGGFVPAVKSLGPRLVDATIELHKNVMQGFLPSAVKFHYQFNLRELSNITQVKLLLPTFRDEAIGDFQAIK